MATNNTTPEESRPPAPSVAPAGLEIGGLVIVKAGDPMPPIEEWDRRIREAFAKVVEQIKAKP